MRPGWIEFTVTPSVATSQARPLAHRCRAALAATAALRLRGSMLPVMLTMRPQRRRRMAGSSAVDSRRADVKLSAIASSQKASSASTVVGREPPAQFTRMSTGPSAAVASSARRSRSAAPGDVTGESPSGWHVASMRSTRRAVATTRAPCSAKRLRNAGADAGAGPRDEGRAVPEIVVHGGRRSRLRRRGSARRRCRPTAAARRRPSARRGCCSPGTCRTASGP